MGSGISTAIITILVFGGIILFHEFGHFITAKRCGVSVWEFSIGMGPAIYTWERGETLYAVRLLPIGGYVMLEGEEEDVESENSLSQKPLWQRLMVFAAGSVNNLLLGYILLVIITAMNGYVGTTYIAKFNEGATSNSVLQLGDKITHINGNEIKNDETVLDFIENSKAGDTATFTILFAKSNRSKDFTVKFKSNVGQSSYQKVDNSSADSDKTFDFPNGE